jgi:Papain family cysteine protease
VADFRDRLPTVRDQGMRSTCVAFASSVLNDLDGADHSPEFLAWCGWHIDGLPNEDSGMYLDAAGRALSRLGQPLEGIWPYLPTSAGQPPLAVFRDAFRNRAHSYARRAGFDPFVCQVQLAAGLPIVAGLDLYENFYRLTAASPELDAPEANDGWYGLHAVAIVGHRGGPYPWVIRNSWGETWGDSGYAYASDNSMTAHVREMMILRPP